MTPAPHPPLEGTFEAHLTVPLAAASGREGWRGPFQGACKDLGLKPLLIEAPGAALPLQPMTSSFHRGHLAGVEEEVRSLAGRLGARGFPVSRIKLEAVGRQNPYLPEHASDLAWGRGRYFEFHVQAHLSSTSELARLRALAGELGVHLSHNPRRVLPEGQSDRFLTLRLRGVGRDEALARHSALCGRLRAEGVVITPGTIEFALLDTRVELDAGWAS